MSVKARKKKNLSGIHNCEICGRPEFLQTHHIRGRDIPNANSKSNLVDICSCCHTSIHMGKMVIEGYIMTDGGYKLAWHYKDEESLTGDDAIPHIIVKPK